MDEAGMESFYDDYTTEFLGLPFPLNWTGSIISMTNNNPTGSFTTSSLGGDWNQWLYYEGYNWAGNIFGAARGLAASGWELRYSQLVQYHSKAKYTGPLDIIYYWIGRLRTCYGGLYRYDFVSDGWLTVVSGSVIKECPYSDSSTPFPLASLSYPGAAYDYYKTQAVTLDVQFMVLGSDSTSFAKQMNLVMGQWLDNGYIVSPPPT
jgi:hypothetical protein